MTIVSTPHSSSQQQSPLPRVAALSPRLTRWMLWTQVLVAVLTGCFWGAYILHQHSVAESALRSDFIGVYVGARIVAIGRGSQLYDLQLQRTVMEAAILPYRRRNLMPFIYPAYVAVLLRPLGNLNFGNAYLVWLLINLAAIIFVILGLVNSCANHLSERLGIVLVCFAWVPLQLTLFHGQLGMLPTLGILHALLSFRSGHQWRAGWWLSLGLLKPQLVPFVLLTFLIWRSWRVLSAFFIVLAAIVGLSFHAAGFWIAKYANFLVDYNRLGPALSLYPTAMQNWRGLVSTLLHANHGSAVVTALLSLTLISILLACRLSAAGPVRPQLEPEPNLRLEARYATVVILGLLSSPHLYMHDWVVAVPFGIILWFFAQGVGITRSQEKLNTASLLCLLGFAPLLFAAVQFIGFARVPPVPLYMAAVVIAAVICTRESADPNRLLQNS